MSCGVVGEASEGCGSAWATTGDRSAGVVGEASEGCGSAWATTGDRSVSEGRGRCRVGALVGAVGTRVGAFDRARVGNRVGAFEGDCVGALEGNRVGTRDGALVGVLDRALVGVLVGALLGALEGARLGALEGARVGLRKIVGRPGSTVSLASWSVRSASSSRTCSGRSRFAPRTPALETAARAMSSRSPSSAMAARPRVIVAALMTCINEMNGSIRCRLSVNLAVGYD
jgi:hypothetical protein